MSQLTDDSVHAGSPLALYKSRFDRWDTMSWVRAKSHHVEPFEDGLDMFPQTLAVLFTHPEVHALDADNRARLLALHLYDFLERTIWLELGPVNEACDMLRRDDFLPWLPVPMKDDALKIYVDEGAHAEMSRALMILVEKATGVRPARVVPEFIRVIDRLCVRHGPEHHPFIKLFFAIVSETLITGTLIVLPRDQTIQKAVRSFATDHAADEAKHHAYFRDVFETVWPRLTPDARLTASLWLPEILVSFLRPDVNAMTAMLGAMPCAFTDPARIAADVVATPATHAAIQAAARPTLQLFLDNGVFDDPRVVDAFWLAGIEPSPGGGLAGRAAHPAGGQECHAQRG